MKPRYLVLLVGLPACDRVQPRMEITHTREISALAPKPTLNATSATRFFDNAAQDAEQPKEHPLLWTVPAGWKENPATQMRLVDLRFGPGDEGECYLAALPGPAGGLSANINRWRTQMGLGALSDEEIGKLPRKPLMGSESYFVSADGAFQGMGDAASAKKDYRLLGLIQAAPELTIFIKMTGPKALVEANQAAFDAFCGSVQFRKKQDIPMH